MTRKMEDPQSHSPWASLLVVTWKYLSLKPGFSKFPFNFITVWPNCHTSYRPGDVFISYSDALVHRVSHWTMPDKPNFQDEVTPGRIGSVFYFPEQSLEELKDRPKGWAQDTAHGHAAL